MPLTHLRYETLPVDRLTQFPGNAKRGDVDTILSSLRASSQYRTVVVRDEGEGRLVILAGNHTVQAITKHGPGDCGHQGCGLCRNDRAYQPAARVDVVECDDDTATRVNVADNRSAEKGHTDYDALSELLGSLDTLEGTGYTSQDLEDITNLLAAPPDEPEELVEKHGAPNEDVFRPQIKITVDAGVFDRWRRALDHHDGTDDEAKLRGLLNEVEQYRGAAA
jgi:ParB-like chromosome segregation protein Spo0J